MVPAYDDSRTTGEINNTPTILHPTVCEEIKKSSCARKCLTVSNRVICSAQAYETDNIDAKEVSCHVLYLYSVSIYEDTVGLNINFPEQSPAAINGFTKSRNFLPSCISNRILTLKAVND